MLLFSFFNAQGKENRSECVVPEPSRDKQEEEKKQMSVRQVFFFSENISNFNDRQ